MEQKIKNLTLSTYLKRMMNKGVEPNFYMSFDYLSRFPEIRYFQAGENVWAEDDEFLIFPPSDALIKSDKKVWCDYEGSCLRSGAFFDYEYIYDPAAFLSMKGGAWEKFRKNSRKWEKRSEPGWVYEKINPLTEHLVYGLLEAWVLDREEKGIEDGDFIIDYCTKPLPFSFRKGVFTEAGELVSMNVWDSNWKYINHRVCMVKPGEAYLSEFTRLQFYLDKRIQSAGKLVNDGGIVDNVNLEKFKDSLNPIIKRKRIYQK